jgi:hypothetical protein
VYLLAVRRRVHHRTEAEEAEETSLPKLHKETEHRRCAGSQYTGVTAVMDQLLILLFGLACYLVGYFHGTRKHVIAKGQVINPRYWGNDE